MITPIILEQDINKVAEKLEQIRGQEKKVHIDIIDGFFVDNYTVSPADLRGVDLSPFEIDLHLLVDDPLEWVEECLVLKPAYLIAQIERMGSIEAYLDTVREYSGVKAGIALDIYTPIADLSDAVLVKSDAIILMSIRAGFAGQKFMPEVLTKIEKLRVRYKGRIIIDGGINKENYKLVLEAGATEAGANSSYWKGEFNEKS